MDPSQDLANDADHVMNQYNICFRYKYKYVILSFYLQLGVGGVHSPK